MYQVTRDKPVEVFEPTLREIEFISDLFERVTWLGFRQGKNPNPGHARRPSISNIELAFLPSAVGGKSFISKLKIVPVLPILVLRLWRAIRQNDTIHTRGPSVPALIGILFSFFDPSRIYWHKYAGNWMQSGSPLFYAIQKRMLLKQRRSVVTINGQWARQPEHILSFENPCFSEVELKEAEIKYGDKKYDGKLIFCFVGLIAKSKGILNILRGLAGFNTDRIQKFIVVGNGPDLREAMSIAENLKVPVEFRGYLTRTAINKIYELSHVIALPSRSEGFPKVIAEGASYGCIPVVTNVSSISQYVKHRENGFMLSGNEPETISATFEQIVNEMNLHAYAMNVTKMAYAFTYERYRDRIIREVLKIQN